MRTSLKNARQGFAPTATATSDSARCQRPHPMGHHFSLLTMLQHMDGMFVLMLNVAAREEMLRKSDGTLRRRMRLTTGGGEFVETDSPPMLPS